MARNPFNAVFVVDLASLEGIRYTFVVMAACQAWHATCLMLCSLWTWDPLKASGIFLLYPLSLSSWCGSLPSMASKLFNAVFVVDLASLEGLRYTSGVLSEFSLPSMARNLSDAVFIVA